MIQVFIIQERIVGFLLVLAIRFIMTAVTLTYIPSIYLHNTLKNDQGKKEPQALEEALRYEQTRAKNHMLSAGYLRPGFST